MLHFLIAELRKLPFFADVVSVATSEGKDQQDFLSDISQPCDSGRREFSTLSPNFLLENGKRTVILTHVNDAEDFYVAIKEPRMDAAFDAMQCGLNQHFSSLAGGGPGGDGQNKETLLEPRAPVIALYEENGEWYRARVIGTVFFVDYGNKEQVKLISRINHH